MRIRLLMASLVDKALYALNMKQAHDVTAEEDAKRTALLGDESSIQEQTHRARVFSEDVASRL